MILRLLLALIMGCGWCLNTPAVEIPRLELDQDKLEDLPQEERFSFMDAQKPLMNEKWKAAALGFHGFSATYPESLLWVHAAWFEAFALLRSGQNNSAIERLAEVIHTSPDAAEMPEVLLLQGECWQGQGEFIRAQQIYRTLIEKFPLTSASLVGRVHIDECITNLGQQQRTKPDLIEAARLQVLTALPKMSAAAHDGRALREGLERLSEIHITRGRLKEVLDLTRETLLANPQELLNYKPQIFASDMRRRICTIALESGDDALFNQVAAEAWTDPITRGVQVATLRCDLFQSIIEKEPIRIDLAKRRKVDPAALMTTAREGMVTVGEAALAIALTLPVGPKRDEMAWLSVRALQLTNRKDAASKSINAMVEGFGRDVNADMVGQFVAMGIAAGLPTSAVHNIVDHVPEGQPRTLAIFSALYQETNHRVPDALRKDAASQAVTLASHLADELPERQAEFLNIQGRLKDRKLAVAILRQVCDEFPDSPQYSEAHVYLQSHLDVTYTGGGGQRQK